MKKCPIIPPKYRVGKAQQKWGDLTNDDLDKIEGSRTELVGKIQQKYGKSKEEAEREVNDFEKGH